MREQGYYWVNYHGVLMIMCWTLECECWYYVGVDHWYLDNELREIHDKNGPLKFE